MVASHVELDHVHAIAALLPLRSLRGVFEQLHMGILVAQTKVNFLLASYAGFLVAVSADGHIALDVLLADELATLVALSGVWHRKLLHFHIEMLQLTRRDDFAAHVK